MAAPRGFEPGFTGPKYRASGESGAEDGTRTRDPHLGKVMLYQLSHFRSSPRRVVGAESQIRTGDTAIFSRVLYQLSYLGPSPQGGGPPVGGREDTTRLPRETRKGARRGATRRPDRSAPSAAIQRGSVEALELAHLLAGDRPLARELPEPLDAGEDRRMRREQARGSLLEL